MLLESVGKDVEVIQIGFMVIISNSVSYLKLQKF